VLDGRCLSLWVPVAKVGGDGSVVLAVVRL
jgi:hypothetical protein